MFRGRAALRSGDLHRTASWLSSLAPDLAAGLAALPARNVVGSGDVEVSAAGAVGRDLRLDVDGSAFAGLLSLTRAVGAEPARLFADLTSEALVLDGLPDLSGAGAAMRDLDLDLSLAARAVTLADPGPDLALGRIGPIAAGHVALRLTKARNDIRLERLSLDVDGAAVDATASRAGHDGHAEVHVSAPHLGPLADALGGSCRPPPRRCCAPAPPSCRRSTRHCVSRPPRGATTAGSCRRASPWRGGRGGRRSMPP